MAKQIKVIKCPQCGSSQKTEIKPEHYRCDNCQTEYFLDSDDVNVNINHHFKNVKSDSLQRPIYQSNTFRLVVFVVTVLIVSMIIGVLMHEDKKTPQYRPQTQTNLNSVNQQTNQPKPFPVKKYSVSNYPYCNVKIDKKPYVIAVREFYESEQPGIVKSTDLDIYFTVYDLLANKMIIDEKQNKPKQKSGYQLSHDWSVVDTLNNQTYLSVNGRNIYHLDKNSYKFNDITRTLLRSHENYAASGIATVNVSHQSHYNGIYILTNDGKKLMYYPDFDSVYEDNYDFQMGKIGPTRPKYDDKTVRLAFGFANSYGENNKLIKYHYISGDGKDHYELISKKIGDYNDDNLGGKFTDNDSAYVFFANTNLKSEIIDHKNLTPGRAYFNPRVIYYDDNLLIIKTKLDASPDSVYNYQRLDTQSGQVVWTIPSDEITINKITPYQGGLIAQESCNKYTIIDNEGKITQRIELVTKNNNEK